MPQPILLLIEPGVKYQTTNNRTVEIVTQLDNGFWLGLLKPITGGTDEQYTWRPDGSFDRGGDASIGIPHEWDLKMRMG